MLTVVGVSQVEQFQWHNGNYIGAFPFGCPSLEKDVECTLTALCYLYSPAQDIDPEYLQIFDELRSLTDDHFAQFRSQLHSANPPCVPFLGIFLTDLIFSEGSLHHSALSSR